MKLNMHNVIASAILCTVLLVSFGNAYPYPVYWDREAFLEQLQQEERVGTDVEARIEQEILECYFRCNSSTVLFISNDSRVTLHRPQTPIHQPFIVDCNEPKDAKSITIYGIKYILSCFSPCPELSISNGVVEYHGIDNKLEPRDPDTTATYSCSGDYKLQGGKTRNCGRNGEWSGEAPTCILQCPELQDIPNGFVNFASRKPGATASYSCMEGYDLNGAETRTCGEDGRWSGQEPTCESTCEIIQKCPNPITVFNTTNTNPSNVRILMDFNTNQVLGSEFDYKCKSGFVLFVSKNGGAYERASSDSITYECLRSTGSTFDPSIRENGRPKCFPLCPELPNISNGTVRVTGREPGDTATYSCNSGFDPQGTYIRTCGRDGTWSDQEPTCKKQPSTPPGELPRCKELNSSDIPNNVPEAKRQVKNHRNYQQILFTPYYNRRIGGNRSEGSKAYLTCVNGWKLLEGTPAVQTCVSVNGELVWTPAGTCVFPIPKCPELKLSDIPKNVPEADDKLKYHPNYQQLRYTPYYNRRIEGDRSEGSKAYLTCVKGWKLEGGTPDVQTCVSVNGELVWTEAGTCVFHYTYPRPKNG